MYKSVCKYRFLISLAGLIIYYVVGITLLKTSDNKEEIIALTPFTLLFTMIVLLVNHIGWSIRLSGILLLIIITGFAVEVIGVLSGFPFGFYHYSDVLGLKLFETPVIMGVNWGMLVYAGTLFFHPMKIYNWLKPVLTGILLVILDIFIEPFAIKWNLWQWNETVPPLQNYLSWTIIAIFFSWLLNKNLDKSMRNKIVFPVLLIQFLFFLILSS
jgi:putative membrane protein